MSGRGKGGKGVVKRKRDYEWSSGEEAVLISYLKPNDYELNGLFFPVAKLHKLIAKAVKRAESADFEWDFDDIDTFETLIEQLEPIDAKRFFEDIETDDECEEEEDDEDFEMDNNEIVESVKEWCNESLEEFKTLPSVAIQCVARIVLLETE